MYCDFKNGIKLTSLQKGGKDKLHKTVMEDYALATCWRTDDGILRMPKE